MHSVYRNRLLETLSYYTGPNSCVDSLDNASGMRVTLNDGTVIEHISVDNLIELQKHGLLGNTRQDTVSINTDNVITAASMFTECPKLTQVPTLTQLHGLTFEYNTPMRCDQYDSLGFNYETPKLTRRVAEDIQESILTQRAIQDSILTQRANCDQIVDSISEEVSASERQVDTILDRTRHIIQLSKDECELGRTLLGSDKIVFNLAKDDNCVTQTFSEQKLFGLDSYPGGLRFEDLNW